ncbi:hypothetical protein PFISCL1PPCAC_22216, partial [Pristionchus fissidentatus]
SARRSEKSASEVSLNLSALSIVAIVSYLYGSSLPSQDAFASTFSRLWQFMFGACAFHLEQYLSQSEKILDSSSLPVNRNQILLPFILGFAFFIAHFIFGFDQVSFL